MRILSQCSTVRYSRLSQLITCNASYFKDEAFHVIGLIEEWVLIVLGWDNTSGFLKYFTLQGVQ